MNTLTKSAIAMATIAGASATGLRFEVAANTNFEQAMQMQSWETSFLEKASAAYDCVGTAMEQITEVSEKSAAALKVVEAQCAAAGSTSKYHNALTLHNDKMGDIHDLEEKRKTGDMPVKYDCTANCETPNTYRNKDKKTHDDALAAANSASDKRVTDSQALVTKAEQHFNQEKGHETAHDATVANTIKTKKAAIQLRIDGIAARLKTDKETAQQNLNNNIQDADDAKKIAEQACDTINKDRTDLIEGDEKLLNEIKQHLETLKMCTAAHARADGTAFLETKAAQRLEAHCAVSRQKVAKEAPSGDLTAWFAKIKTEKSAAAAKLTQCYDAAKEVERAAVEGPSMSPNTVSGYNYVHSEAVRVLEDAAAEATKQENSAIDTMVETEEATKASYQAATKAAQDAVDDQKLETGNVETQEANEKIANKKQFDNDETLSLGRYTNSLAEQHTALEGRITAEKAALETTNKEIKAACDDNIAELKNEADIVGKILSKIALLKVVGREPAVPTTKPDVDTTTDKPDVDTTTGSPSDDGEDATGTF